MSDLIQSRLLKAHRLAGNSIIFPQLVEAACWKKRIQFSRDVVNWAASQPSVVDAVQVPADGDCDAWLQGALQTIPEEVDQVVETVVASYPRGTTHE